MKSGLFSLECVRLKVYGIVRKENDRSTLTIRPA